MVLKQKKTDKNENNARGQLSIERIVQVAMELLNKEGINQLSMRKLADALGIKAASLYWHVKDKAELLQHLAEEICSRINMPDKELPWQEQLITGSKEYRKALLTVRDSTAVLIETMPITPERLKQIDMMYGIFDKAGFSPVEVVLAANFLNNYVLSFVMDELHMMNVAREQGVSIEELRRLGNNMFLSLPKEQYPFIAKVSNNEWYEDMDKEFLFGIQVMIDGLEKRLKDGQ